MIRRRPRLEADNIAGTTALSVHDLPVAALIVGQDGTVVEANAASASLLGQTAVEPGSKVGAVLGWDPIWGTPDGTRRATRIHIAAADGRPQSVDAWTSSVPDGSSRTLITLVPATAARPAIVSGAPRIEPWADVATRVGAIAGEVLCAVVGLVGLQSVNRSVSRSTGDAVLAEVCRRLQQMVGVDGVVARVSGNRFAVVKRSQEPPAAMIQRILGRVPEPIDAPLGRVAVGCSIGATFGETRSSLVLLERADRHATVALRRGAGSVEWSSEGDTLRAESQARLAGALGDAVSDGLISAHFQPVVDLRTGDVADYEALARWAHPAGHLAAGEFIGVAQATGKIVEVGARVLHLALDLAGRLREQGNGCHRVSVNLSSRELADPQVVGVVSAQLASARVRAADLQIEITQRVAAHDVTAVDRNIRELRASGVRVAFDGVGRANGPDVTDLRELTVDAVKLDRSVLEHATSRERDARILRAFVRLGNELGLDVIATGTETTAQRELLRRLGCRYAQGFLFGLPMTADEVVASAALRSSGPPPVADNEQRLGAVRACLSGDAATDPAVAEVVRWAMRACGTPAAAVSFIDSDREWFATSVGISLHDAPRAVSFADHAITGGIGPGAVVQVPDADQDGRVLHHPLVTGDDTIRSFAGAPLVLSSGHVVGFLTVMDREPRGFDDVQVRNLSVLADLVAARIEIGVGDALGRLAEPQEVARS